MYKSMLCSNAALLSVGFLSSLSTCLPAMMRLAQQQLSSSAARANSWMPLTHLLQSIRHLLGCWHELVEQVPAFMQVVVRTLLPLVQQLQGCNSLLMRPAAAAAAVHNAPAVSAQAGSSSSSSSSSTYGLQATLFAMQHAASMLMVAIDGREQLNAGVAADVLRLQNDPAVVEMQLQLLTAWTAQMHKQHTAQQQQQSLPSTAAARSSTQQEQQQPAKQRHRADLLSIPAFHQDMLQLLPGGQAYLDAAAEEAATWGTDWEANAVQLCTHAGACCHTINHYLYSHLESIAGQQQLSRNAALVSAAAVRLVLELQLLASGAVQRQRERQQQQQQQRTEQQRQQQQQRRQQTVTQEDRAITDVFSLQTFDLLGLQIKALAATSASCLPPEVLQQAGLQLLQALAAPLQQWQLCRAGDSFMHNAAVAGALPRLGGTLHGLVTAACGAPTTYGRAPIGEHDQWFKAVCLAQPQLLCLCNLRGKQPP
jgi:hypothetical protein